MSAPIDVLAVIDIAATSIEQSGGNVAYMRQARAAVAELIEAVDLLARLADEASTEGRFANGIGEELDALEAAQATLARVKGGAA
ncbi:TPA: hypothetical protein ACOEQH_000456 [Stenotrophomonas maltophilia]